MSGIGPARLILRQLRAAPAASVVLAVIVLVSAFVASLAPRALDRLFTEELRYSVGEVSATQRDLVGTTLGAPPTGFPELLDGVRTEMSATLRAAAGEARYVSTTPALGALPDVPDRDAPTTVLSLSVDPRYDEVISIIEGALPGPIEPLADGGFAPIEFVLSEPSAEAMRWSIGEVRTVRATGGAPQQFVLVGTFEALEPESDYWQFATSVLDPFLFDDGNATPTVTAIGYIDPSGIREAWAVMGSLSTTSWFRLTVDDLTFTESTALLQGLREFTSSTHDIDVDEELQQDGDIAFLSFSSGLIPSLDRVEGRASSTVAVLSMAVAGPLGVVLAVLALGSRAVLERRRAGLALASARGASPLQLRGAMAAEGLLLGLPAAALGMLAAAALIPAPVGAEAAIVPLALALAPAVLLASGAVGRGLRAERADLEPGRGTRARLVIEIVVVALAALAVFLLLRRGLTSSGPAVDPLLAATPLLLALAVCVLVLRLYPYPLQAITSLLRRRAGLTGFLGAARAVRDPAAGVAPVLALVVGVSVAVFSGILVTTIDRGVGSAARAVVGADLQARGPVFDPAQLEAIATTAGVASVAGVDDAGPAILGFGGDRRTVTVLVVDTDALRDQRGADAVPTDMSVASGDAVPIIVSADLARELGDEKPQLEGDDTVVVGVGDANDGIGYTTNWVMIDASASLAVMGVEFRPRTVLVGLESGADAAAIAAGITDTVGGGVITSWPGQVAAELRASPTVSGLGTALLIALALAAGLSAVAVVMTSVVGARSRSRMLALLSTLGMRARGTRALVAWELAPVGLGALLAGVALGVAMPWIVLGGVDLRPFTGGATQPAIVVDPGQLLLLVGGFATLATVSVLVAAAAGRRMSTATALRIGEE